MVVRVNVATFRTRGVRNGFIVLEDPQLKKYEVLVEKRGLGSGIGQVRLEQILVYVNRLT